jgi:hypothetical protein
MVRVAVSMPPPTLILRISPARPLSSRQSSVISIQSPSAKLSTASLPRLSTTRCDKSMTLVTRDTTDALSRDHLKVAVPSGPLWWISIR